MGISIDREKVIKGLETCIKYIDRECPIGCPYHEICTKYEGRVVFQPVLRDALALLKEQKAEAKWIYGEDETGVDGWYCSECNFFEPWFYEFTEDIDFIRFYGHCPKCGRRMTSYTGKQTQERQ